MVARRTRARGQRGRSKYGALVPSVSEKQTLVAAISRHKQLDTLASCLELGEVVLKRFYSGSLTRLRRLGSAHVSFHNLRDDPEVPVDGLALYRALMTYEAYQRQRGWRFEHLDKSHYRAVFGLAPSHQRRLLERAEKLRLTVNQLNHEATLVRPQAQGAPPPRPAFEKSLRAIRKLADPDSHAFADLDRAGELSDAERRRLARLAKDLSQRFSEIAKALRARV